MPTSGSSTFDTLRVEIRGAAAIVILSRPHALNALTHRALEELRDACAMLRDDPAVRGLVVTGDGDQAFAAGADIKEIADADAVQAARMTRFGQSVFEFVEHLGKPVVAAVNGLALGGGCELAMACTLRLASPRASFGQPEIKLGLIPGYGGTQRLARLVGKSAALQLILTGASIDAATALRIGLVDELVDADRLLARAEEIIAQIARNAPLAVGYALEAVTQGLLGAPAQGYALESTLFALCAATEDKQEGTRAFLEKRAPAFKGR